VTKIRTNLDIKDPIGLAPMVNPFDPLKHPSPTSDPIQLVWMVKQFERCAGENLFTIQTSWMGSCTGFVPSSSPIFFTTGARPLGSRAFNFTRIKN
jgi:hypothetical protein